MKAMNRKLYIMVLLLFLTSVSTKASHLFGGEITWHSIQTDLMQVSFSLPLRRTETVRVFLFLHLQV